MSLWLTAEDVEQLTGFERPKRQKMALAQIGLKFRSRPADGFPLVGRWQFEARSFGLPRGGAVLIASQFGSSRRRVRNQGNEEVPSAWSLEKIAALAR